MVLTGFWADCGTDSDVVFGGDFGQICLLQVEVYWELMLAQSKNPVGL